MQCRACNGRLTAVIDLGQQPSEGRFPLAGDPPDALLPLRLGMCGSCGLAQLADPSPPEADDPASPSPLSSATMSTHANGFVDELVARGLAIPSARILSVASHGGHLAPFLSGRGLQATVLEASPARAARLDDGAARIVVGGIDGASLPAGLAAGAFDLVVDSYLLAHLEHPRRAIRNLAALVAPGGALVLELDYLLATVEGGQWDAIRHGHQTYLALGWVARELRAAGLEVADIVPQPVYGGALRIFARAGATAGQSVGRGLARETAAAIDRPQGLQPLGEVVEQARRDVVSYLRAARAEGRHVAGYGAPARSVTFLNALGIGPDLLPYLVDRAPSKQGRTVPGPRIPIRGLEALSDDPPAEVLILAWDLAGEVIQSLADVVPAGTTFLVAVPQLSDAASLRSATQVRSAGDDVR